MILPVNKFSEVWFLTFCSFCLICGVFNLQIPVSITRRTAMSSNKRVHSDKSLDTENIKKLKGSSGSSNSSLPFTPSDFIASRAKLLTNGDYNKSLNINGKCVVYWMSRDQRAEDNHAMHYAQVQYILSARL